ncbi:MAG: hypothetical protein J5829_01995 [Lachnospiraceae bacterium]|nr:hypothetical protein [Lachnospiraceae bacterium]
MNKPIAIIVLIILVLFLVILLRILIPAFTNYLKNLPKGIFVLLVLAVIAAMVYLVVFLIKSNGTGGEIGNTPEEVETQVEEEKNEVVLERIEDCIILRDDQIWINNVQVGMDFVEKYIDEHVVSNTHLTIVDDYSLASLHHEITALCDKKGVNYSNEDEKWIE